MIENNSSAITVESPEPAVSLPEHERYHLQCCNSAQETALWAAMTGLSLLRRRQEVKHGGWLDWVKVNCSFSDRSARNYIGAAERAVAKLYSGDPSQIDYAVVNFEAVQADIAVLLDADHLAEQRAALIAAIRPQKPAKPSLTDATARPPRPRKPPVPAAERPLFTPKALPVVAERWRHTPQEVRHAFLDSIRDDALAYFGLPAGPALA